MVTHLNRTFRQYYRTTRRTNIDESMILFKGRRTLNQYNAQKLIKRGYKLWCQTDQNAYVSDFEIYQGKNEKIEHFDLVKELYCRQQNRIRDKIMYDDNYLMSIRLLKQLRFHNTVTIFGY